MRRQTLLHERAWYQTLLPALSHGYRGSSMVQLTSFLFFVFSTPTILSYLTFPSHSLPYTRNIKWFAIFFLLLRLAIIYWHLPHSFSFFILTSFILSLIECQDQNPNMQSIDFLSFLPLIPRWLTSTCLTCCNSPYPHLTPMLRLCFYSHLYFFALNSQSRLCTHLN